MFFKNKYVINFKMFLNLFIKPNTYVNTAQLKLALKIQV